MTEAAPPEPLVRAAGLTKVFGHPVVWLSRRARGGGAAAGGRVIAVAGVDLDIGENESVGLVGESGSGKTTVARCLLRLVTPTSGTIPFDGSHVLDLSGEQLMAFR